MSGRGDAGFDAVAQRAVSHLGWAPCEIKVARGPLARLLGMTVRGPLGSGGAPLVMAFPRCRSVHTCYMGYLLDIAFIDAEGEVVELYEGVPPWRFLACPHAAAVLERFAGVRDRREILLDRAGAAGYSDLAVVQRQTGWPDSSVGRAED